MSAGAPRVAVLAGPVADRLARRLEAEGERVSRAATLEELKPILAGSVPDAVILDLTAARTPSKGRTSGKQAKPGKLDARGAFVLAIATGGKAPATAPLKADVCVAPKESDRALREVRGAVAMRRLSQALEELERLRSAVSHARRTAHDLAQPLTTIMARAQILAAGLAPTDPHARPIGIICEESARLATLIEEFQKLKEMSRRPGSGSDQAK